MVTVHGRNRRTFLPPKKLTLKHAYLSQITVYNSQSGIEPRLMSANCSVTACTMLNQKGMLPFSLLASSFKHSDKCPITARNNLKSKIILMRLQHKSTVNHFIYTMLKTATYLMGQEHRLHLPDTTSAQQISRDVKR